MKKTILFLVIALAGIALCNAQTKPDSLKLPVSELQKLTTYQPVWLICFSTRKNASKQLFRIAGYILANQAFNEKKQPLGSTVFVKEVLRREVKK